MTIKTLLTKTLFAATLLASTASFAQPTQHGHTPMSPAYYQPEARSLSPLQRQLLVSLHMLNNVASHQLRNEHRHEHISRRGFYPRQCLHQRACRHPIPRAYRY